MGDDFVAPVKLLIKSLDTGIKLSISVLESASFASTTKALQISECAPNVQKSLERTSQAIRDAYVQTIEACGEPFGKALVEDKSIAKRLKELKNEVRDKIELADCEDDPDSFDPAAFANIQKEAQKSYAECISIFNRLRAHILEARVNSPVDKPRDDRAFLTSMRAPESPLTRKPLPSVFQNAQPRPAAPVQASSTVLPSPLQEPVKPQSPWAINGPSQFDMGHLPQGRQLSRDISPSSLPNASQAEGQPSHIAKEVVRYRISANDEFLERRRQSKIFFQNELRRQATPRSPSIVSMERPLSDRRISGTIEENRVSEVFQDGPLIPSPQLGNSVMASSPIDGRTSRASSNGYDQMVSRQRSLGQNSQDARNSRSSSYLYEGTQRQDLHRHDSTTSQDSIFGLRAATQSPTAPLSPPLSDHGISGGLNIEHLATTLRTPVFGRDVEDGMEVVNGAYDFSTEKMVVVTNDLPPAQNNLLQATPTASVTSIDCPMRHDTSFYQYRGFCEGAAILLRGRYGEDWYKIVKRPSGHYSATVSAKCVKCAYEVGFNDLQRDKILDLTGIYMNSGIRWRQRFVTKSHVRTTSTDAGVYACVFCVEEHKTVEDHDATIFFSVQQLFRHLAKHSQPLPNVPGVTVIYGVQPMTVLDFDIHFTTPIPKIPEFSMSEILQKVATRPSGHASVTHHPKSGSSSTRDPAGEPVLHFAIGARIVGITFPERFKGEWCSGYHDGERGSFPANTIILEQPPAEDYMMNPKSTLVATARWDFKPKDAKDMRWLKFSKGDKITCIGYVFVDQWCWSGQDKKGRWGIFPRAFVENLVDGTKLAMSTSPGSVRSSGFGSRMTSFSLGRKSSRQERTERSMSIRSTGSNGSVGVIMEGQPGLEVAPSPTQQVRTVGSWRV